MRRIFTALTLSLLPGLYAHGLVNLKNGNYSVTTRDVCAAGAGEALCFEKTYNSKTSYSGIFGVGYGSLFETRLSVNADGTVTVFEYGTGARIHFSPKGAVDVDGAVEKIIAAVKKKSDKALSAAYLDQLKKQLKESVNDRQRFSKEYGVEAQIADNTTLFSVSGGPQELKKTKDGFFRTEADGSKHHFNLSGQLVKIVKNGGPTIDISYSNLKNPEGFFLPLKISDSSGKQLTFAYDSDKQISKISSSSKTEAKYTFKNKNLLTSLDMDGNLFTYKWDSNSNLLEETNKEGKSIKLSYKDGMVVKVEERDGRVATFDYKYINGDKNHYSTTVKRTNPNTKVTNEEYYEYKTKVIDGRTITISYITRIDGRETKVTNTECCGLPESITSPDGRTVRFAYNELGLLTKKTTPEGIVEMEYDKACEKKISKINDNGAITTYSYDKGKGCNLVKAVKDKEIAIVLDYELSTLDGTWRLAKMASLDLAGKSRDVASRAKEKILTFKYKNMDKPSEVSSPGVGSMQIDYDLKTGDITNVRTTGSDNVSLEISTLFSNLLEVVRPAGVTIDV
jgi:YD repeat-containing protein